RVRPYLAEEVRLGRSKRARARIEHEHLDQVKRGVISTASYWDAQDFDGLERSIARINARSIREAARMIPVHLIHCLNIPVREGKRDLDTTNATLTPFQPDDSPCGWPRSFECFVMEPAVS